VDPQYEVNFDFQITSFKKNKEESLRMKKLLVVALSAMLVLAYATVSMAAVTVTGECNVGLQVAPDNAQKGDMSDCKVVFDAAVNDTVSVNAAIKTSFNEDAANPQTGAFGFDTYSISSKMDMGTLKFGYFEHNLNGKTDILGKVIGGLKPASLIQFAANVGEGMTATVSYDYNDGSNSNYVASFKYDVAPLMVEVGMASYAGTSGTALNVGYGIGDAITVYLNYESVPDTSAKDTIVGVLYTADALSARLEYDANKEGLVENPMGLSVAYTAANSLVYTLTYAKDGSGADATMKVKVTAKF
jgi:hypothetical protein